MKRAALEWHTAQGDLRLGPDRALEPPFPADPFHGHRPEGRDHASDLEPPVGIEPTTYSLREARAAAPRPPPAPMAPPSARKAQNAPIPRSPRSTTRSTQSLAPGKLPSSAEVPMVRAGCALARIGEESVTAGTRVPAVSVLGAVLLSSVRLLFGSRPRWRACSRPRRYSRP